MNKHFFVSGTDTDVGKTLVSAALLFRARDLGQRCFGLKPVAAGCESQDGQWRNDDALCLQACSSVSLPYGRLNPYALPDPVSPHIAAKRCGVSLNASGVANACTEELDKGVDFAVVEGAGGWRVPINNRETMADVAQLLGLRVILVVAVRLGCINHGLLSAEAIRSDGLQLIAWVANKVDAAMPAVEQNLRTLADRLGCPCLGYIPYLSDPSPEKASRYLDIKILY